MRFRFLEHVKTICRSAAEESFPAHLNGLTDNYCKSSIRRLGSNVNDVALGNTPLVALHFGIPTPQIGQVEVLWTLEFQKLQMDELQEHQDWELVTRNLATEIVYEDCRL